MPQILAGTVRAYAVTSPERNGAIPDVPTVVESGLPDLVFSVWHGLYVAKDTPPDVVAKLNAALAAAVDDKGVQAKFASVGTTEYPAAQRSIAAHTDLFGTDLVRIGKLVEAAGIKLGDAN